MAVQRYLQEELARLSRLASVHGLAMSHRAIRKALMITIADDQGVEGFMSFTPEELAAAVAYARGERSQKEPQPEDPRSASDCGGAIPLRRPEPK